MNPEKRILIVGGYGHVGRAIAFDIQGMNLGTIIIAGRNGKRAAEVAHEIGCESAVFNATAFGPQEKSVVDQCNVVIVCIDQTETTFVEYCISKNVLYLDITASSTFVGKLQALNDMALHFRSLVVTSLGLCPGFTNLVAAELRTLHPEATEVKTGLLLCLGEEHGRASIEWTLDNYLEDFIYKGKKLRSYSRSHEFSFQRFGGTRNAYRFNFSDQHALARTYPGQDFSTWLCFDSKFISRLLYMIKVLRLDEVVRLKPVKSAIIKLSSLLAFGQQGYSLQAVALRENRILGTVSFSGESTTMATAKFAVVVLKLLIHGQDISGVRDVHELPTLDDVRESFSPLATL